MSAEVIQSKYEELETIARRFGQQAQATRELQRRVQRGADALRNGGWEGRGSAAFTGEMEQKIFPAMQRLMEALAEAQTTTLQVKEIIQKAEEEAASVFRGEQGPSINSQQQKGANTSLWEQFWKSFPGQQGLALLNSAWAFLVGSGHEFGEGYGPGAKTGAIAGDVASSFVVVGDVRDLLIEGYNALHPGREVNELTAILAGIGLAGDLGWVDGIVPDPADAVNAGAAVLKAVVKQLDELPKPVQESVAGLIKWGVKNPSRLDDIAGISQWMLQYHDTPTGKAIVDMVSRGIKDPDWFSKTADIAPWLKTNPERLADLASDGARGGELTYKGLFEAHVGLSLEKTGQLPSPLLRDPDGAAEFIDGNGVLWDIKAFNSKYPGSFQLERELNKIAGEFRAGEKVILDTTDLGAAEVQQLRTAIESKGWSDQVRWYP
jgi:WXG100 family type VII secretion target